MKREAGAMPEGSRARRQVPRDRQARDRAGQEARGLHRALERGHRQRPGERRGAQRARAASTSAPRTARRSPTSSQKQVDTHLRREGEESVLLGKLGQLYGERLNDDEARGRGLAPAPRAQPEDRKAQEALKKKYLTLGRWDDLEVFYAESGKWDEFIRVLESQEAKETDDAGQDRPAR